MLLELLWYILLVILHTLKRIRNRLCGPKPLYPIVLTREVFIQACREDNVKLMSENSLESVDLEEGLTEAVINGHTNTVSFLLEKGAKNVNEALRVACVNNCYAMAELLLKKGADVVIGLRTAKSPNIIRMLYRYEQGTENIN